MRIAFATTQGKNGSTMIGRILPLAEELSADHEVHILALDPVPPAISNQTIHSVGKLPFNNIQGHKKRLSGFRLVFNMLSTALKTAQTLQRLQPDHVIISKPLPHNVLGVALWHLIYPKTPITLDTDDFEFTANKITSFSQRAVLHWAERTAAKIANHITAASPFLADHFDQLTSSTIPITLIPTGIPAELTSARQEATTTTISYIGSLATSSGHPVMLLPDILANVRKSNPEVTLHIFGDGEDKAALVDMFESQGLTDAVTWHGRFTVSELTESINTLGIIIDPIDNSISARAKSSFRLMLAIATGTPVVTSDIGIRHQLVPSPYHQRFFAVPGDSYSYSGKIVDLLATPLTPSDRVVLQEHSTQFRWTTLACQFDNIIAP